MSDLLDQFTRLQEAEEDERGRILASIPEPRRTLLERMLLAEATPLADALDELASEPAGPLIDAFPIGLPARYRESATPPALGGMGVVHRVFDDQLERHVALKMAHPALMETPGYRELFLREPLVPSMLQHPGIIPIYDQALTTEGLPYYTMRFVSHRTLRDDIAASETDPSARSRLLDLFLKVCETVAFTHSKGVVHRDLKPSNISLDEFGSVTLLDWGIAVPFGDDARAQASMSDSQRDAALQLETRFYSPEDGISEPSGDLYSLGVMLAQILAADPDPVRARAWVMAETDEAPTNGDAALPALLEVCRGALAPKASERLQRYPDVTAFADAIRHAQTPALSVLRVQLQHAAALKPAPALALLDELGAGLSAVPVGSQTHKELAASIRALKQTKSHTLARRRRRVVVAAMLAILLPSALWIWIAEGRRQESAAREARLQRLKDAPIVRRLLDEAERLWPAAPNAAARMDRWIETAEDVLPRRRSHQREFEELAAKASRAPVETTPAQAIRWLEADLADLEDYLRRPITETMRGNTAGRAALVREQLVDLRAKQERETVLVSREAPVAFSVFQQLTRGLAELGDEGRLLERMRLRRTAAGGLPESPAVAATWQQVLGALRGEAEERYSGVAPNPRLVPLGADPESGLQEFFVRGTGTMPTRSAAGVLERERDFGVVVVLVPAGTYVRGSLSDYVTREGVQPAPDDEGPLSVVSVSPMYLSKYELTQAQWERMTEGDRPSHERAGRPREGHGSTPGRAEISLDDPVGQISWKQARDVLGRFGLRLPTEAEWEYAAWGGRCTPTLPRGADQSALQVFLEARHQTPPGFWRYLKPEHEAAAYGNFADATFSANRPHDSECATDFDDGHHFHAWVGAFRPNDYGLHDMHGNVNEWVRDILDTVYYEYSRSFDPPGSGAEFDAVERVVKGGSWRDLPRNLHISDRRGAHQDVGHRTVGVRAAMSLAPFRTGPSDPR